MKKKILTLTISKQWFDMIADGKKDEEYREIKPKRKQRKMYKERCCGNCHWFGNEDVYGVGWCSNNEHESSCDQVCDEHEF